MGEVNQLLATFTVLATSAQYVPLEIGCCPSANVGGGHEMRRTSEEVLLGQNRRPNAPVVCSALNAAVLIMRNGVRS
jgi:hypothetical protein